MMSWIDLEKRFRAVEEPLRDLRVDYQSGSAANRWRICGMTMNPTRRQFEMLVDLAGRTLETCAEVHDNLRLVVNAEGTPADHWFDALKELSGQFNWLPYVATFTDDQGNESGHILMGSVMQVVAASANLCLLLGGRYPMPEVQEPQKPTISITDSTVGFVNAGVIQDVRSIETSVTALVQAGQTDIAEALKQLTQAVASAKDLKEKARSEILEQLSELSRQALLPPDKRTKAIFLKASVSLVARALSAVGSLAQIWSTWGPAIQAFFCPG